MSSGMVEHRRTVKGASLCFCEAPLLSHLMAYTHGMISTRHLALPNGFQLTWLIC